MPSVTSSFWYFISGSSCHVDLPVCIPFIIVSFAELFFIICCHRVSELFHASFVEEFYIKDQPSGSKWRRQVITAEVYFLWLWRLYKSIFNLSSLLYCFLQHNCYGCVFRSFKLQHCQISFEIFKWDLNFVLLYQRTCWRTSTFVFVFNHCTKRMLSLYLYTYFINLLLQIVK